MVRALLLVTLLVVAAIGLLAWLQPGEAISPLAGPPPESLEADLELAISERRLDGEMARSLSDNPNILDPSFDLIPPDRAKVAVTVSTEFLGQTVQIRPVVEMSFGVVNGEAVVTAQAMELGGLPLPRWVADLPMREFTRPVEDQINMAADLVGAGSGLELISITTTEKTLILAFA